MTDIEGLIVFTAVALVSSAISTVAGLGGGMLLLVALTAGGMSLAVAIPIHAAVQLVANNTRLGVFFAHVRWKPLVLFSICAAPGPIPGMWLQVRLDEHALAIAFALLIFYATWVPKWTAEKLPQMPAFAIAGALGGVFGVVFGAIGPLVTPFMLREEFTKEQIVATGAVAAAYLHLLKILAFGTNGFDFATHMPLIVPMSIAAVAGTFLGKYLLGKISEKTFRWIVRVLLTLLASRMLVLAVLKLAQPG